MGLQGLVNVVGKRGVFQVGKVFQTEITLRLLRAPGGQGCGTGLFVNHVIRVEAVVLLGLFIHGGVDNFLQAPHQLVRPAVKVRGFIPLSGNDEGGTRFVNQDGVHLVHDGESMAPLNHLIFVDGHVIPQIVETHLIVGAVCDVRRVCGPALVR